MDVSFPDKSKLIDVVFGFCEANINTHFDFDQQLARVRDPGAVRVWINPRRFYYETSVDAVRRELLEQSVFKNLLISSTKLFSHPQAAGRLPHLSANRDHRIAAKRYSMSDNSAHIHGTPVPGGGAVHSIKSGAGETFWCRSFR